ncbi:MAG: GGDEF domain-containing protein [Thermoleophilia bacterium]
MLQLHTPPTPSDAAPPTFAEDCGDAVILVADDGRITSVNAAARRLDPRLAAPSPHVAALGRSAHRTIDGLLRRVRSTATGQRARLTIGELDALVAVSRVGSEFAVRFTAADGEPRGTGVAAEPTWEAMLSALGVGLLVMDPQGRIVTTNDRFLSMAGHFSVAPRDVASLDAWWAGRAVTYERLVQTALRSGRSVSVDTTLRTTTGTALPVCLAATPISDGDRPSRIALTFLETCGGSRVNETPLGKIAGRSSDLLCKHDADGRLHYVSPASTDILGVTPFAATGLPFDEFVHPDDAHIVRSAFRDLNEGAGDRTIVVRRALGDTGCTWLEVSLRPVDEDGQVQVLSATRDVTQRHRRHLEAAVAATVTDAVATGSDVGTAAALFTEEAARALGVNPGTVTLWKFDDAQTATLVGHWGRSAQHRPDRRCTRPHSDDRDLLTVLTERAGGSGAGAPVTVDGRPWGAVIVGDLASDVAPRIADQLLPLARVAGRMIEGAESNALLTRLAQSDALTGLANRAVFDRELENATRDGQPAAVCVLDLDEFKAVNDRFGHATGDQVLCAVARRLRTAVRQDDTIARIGGEEFGWIMPNAEVPDAVRAAERARAIICGTPIASVGQITASFGVSFSDGTGTEPQVMFRRADQALYQAKRHGRNRVHHTLHGRSRSTGEALMVGGSSRQPR